YGAQSQKASRHSNNMSLITACFATYTFNIRVSLFKLTIVQVSIETTGCKQLFMCTALDNVAVLHYEDKISISNGGKPVRNHEGGSAHHQLVHRLLNE